MKKNPRKLKIWERCLITVALIFAAGVLMACAACLEEGEDGIIPDPGTVEESEDTETPEPDEPQYETEAETDMMAAWPFLVLAGGLAVGAAGYKVYNNRTKEKNLTRQQKRALENQQKKKQKQNNSNTMKNSSGTSNNNSQQKAKSKNNSGNKNKKKSKNKNKKK